MKISVVKSEAAGTGKAKELAHWGSIRSIVGLFIIDIIKRRPPVPHNRDELDGLRITFRAP